MPMAAVMNNFVGDGNGYVGDVGLEPEIARTLSLSADWHDAAQARWNLHMTPYYARVEDHIDARCAGTCSGGQFNVLRDVNQSARLFGVDLTGAARLGSVPGAGQFVLRGGVNYTDGKNRDTGDALYNVVPVTARLALVHSLGALSTTLESEWVTRKDDISNVRNEIKTAGYNLIHLRSAYPWRTVRLDVGIENLFDRRYALPQGGTYVGQGSTMGINAVPWGVAVPGPGRSFYAAASYSF